MKTTILGRVMPKYSARIYFHSYINPIRPVFHDLFNVLRRDILADASCDVIFLTNSKNQYHDIGYLTRKNLWQVLKLMRNDYDWDLQLKTHLQEDLAVHRDVQSIIVTRDSSFPGPEDFRHLHTFNTIGLTFITVESYKRVDTQIQQC